MLDFDRSFDAFFKGEASVAVIKGGWGVGKTYFWNRYIDRRVSEKNLSQIAYSYISLFGKTSLLDVKQSLFHSAEAISSNAEIEAEFNRQYFRSSSLLNRLPWMSGGIKKIQSRAPLFNALTKSAQYFPVFGKFSNMISSIEYSLVNNYIICFDDLERKGGTLTVKEVMGLIDELAIRKNCKVVLIFNESSFDEGRDKSDFESYKEKVVDIELKFEPTCFDNMKHVFPNGFEQLPVLTNTVNELDIKNIRVLKKIRWLINDFHGYIESIPDSLREEFTVHATLLCWGYFIRDKDISFDSIKNKLKEKSWISFLSGSDEKKSSVENKYSEIASNLRLAPSVFDVHIIHYLDNGFINEESLQSSIRGLLEMEAVQQVRAKLTKAWGIYADSFDDNIREFIGALKEVIDKDIAKIELADFGQVVDILDEFGEAVSGYIQSYVKSHEQSLRGIASEYSYDLNRIKNQELKTAILNILKEDRNFSIDHIARKIAVDRSWDNEDIDFLSSLDEKDFHSWMKGGATDLSIKIRKGLFIFRSMRGQNQEDDEKYRNIIVNVEAAIKDIASENRLNEKRVKYIYGIEK